MATILLVDDGQESREVLAFVLREAGFTVVEARTGHEALIHAAALRPELAIVDIYLPGMDGFELCRLLKAEPATQRTAVMMVSAVARGGDERADALTAGADALLLRPAERSILLATVSRLLSTRVPETPS